jgi:hypothetical protein
MYTFRELDTNKHGTSEFPCEYYFVDLSHPRYQMPSHWHNDWEILRVLKGKFKLHIDSEQYSASEGDIFLIPSGSLHGGVPHNCIYECFVFDLYGLFRGIDIAKKHFKAFYRGSKIPHCFYKSGEFPEFDKCVDEIMSLFKNDVESEYRELETLTALSGLFTLILKTGCYVESDNAYESHHRIDRIKAVLEYIEENA